MTIAQDHHFSAGFSPNSSPEDAGSMLYDDDSKDLFDFDEKPKKSNGRKGSGPGAADKRATHNAIERARRESLNGRFMTLAEALPSMASVKRPSKSIIVNKALDFVFDAQVKEHALIKENNELRLQVDQLRARLGMQPLPPPSPLLPQDGASTSPSQEQSSPALSAPSPTSPTVGAHLQQSLAPISIPQQHSPTTMFASPTASGRAADSPVSTSSLGGDLTGSIDSLASSSMFAAAPPSQQSGQTSGFVAPMAIHQHQAQQYAQMLQAQAYNGFMNPSLLSQQQLMLAAHLQQQQNHSHHLSQMGLPTAPMHDYGSSHVLPPTTGWGPEAYSPHQPFFMS